MLLSLHCDQGDLHRPGCGLGSEALSSALGYPRAAEGDQVSESLTQEGQSCPTGREGNLVRGSKI